MAAANTSLHEAPDFEDQHASQPQSLQPQSVTDLDAQPAHSHHPESAPPAQPRVVDLDDSANSGLQSYDESYKSVPAFLRHQNN